MILKMFEVFALDEVGNFLSMRSLGSLICRFANLAHDKFNGAMEV